MEDAMNHPTPLNDARVPMIVGAQRRRLATTTCLPWLLAGLLRAMMQVVGLLHAGMLMASAALLMACTIR
jgi:hypothetical protein